MSEFESKTKGGEIMSKPDNTQENKTSETVQVDKEDVNSFDTRLDEIINSAYEGEVRWTHDQLDGTSMVDDVIKGIEDEKAKTKQALLDWHIKQIEGVLDRLVEELPISERMAWSNEDGTLMETKVFQTNMKAFIEAERNKIKEEK